VTGFRLVRESFPAMGTSCAVAVTCAEDGEPRARAAIAVARAEVQACEQALSRFDPASELSRLNAAEGGWTRAGERLRGALRLALWAREETGGMFDPTILPALVAAGYDRSFELLDVRPPRRAAAPSGATVEIDPTGERIRVQCGSAVDLGGIGKGFAAERAVEAMRIAWPGLPGALVDVGGDIAVRGEPPESGCWRLAVADPRVPGESLCTLAVESGGVATSGRDCRRFGPGGSAHHLIDPATGAPARGGPLAVTVVGPDAAWAEAHATALAVTVPDAAENYVGSRPGLSALVVPDEGHARIVGPLPLLERHLLGLVTA
jgi:FAD:protein FMN transferase